MLVSPIWRVHRLCGMRQEHALSPRTDYFSSRRLAKMAGRRCPSLHVELNKESDLTMYLTKTVKTYLSGCLLFALAVMNDPALAATVKGTTPSGAEVDIEIKKTPALKYPKRAERLGVEGYVVVAFDLSESGDILDLRVVEAEPRMVFDKSAMKFVKGMRFEIPEEDGTPTMARDIQFKVGFQLKDRFR